MSAEPVIVVHGGAGNIPDGRDRPKFDGMLTAVRRAYGVYKDTLSVTDACQAAVECMEDDEAFNAGRGSVLNLKGQIEMEALIMEGKYMKAGMYGIPLWFERTTTLTSSVCACVFCRKRNRRQKHCASNSVGQKGDGAYAPRIFDGSERERVRHKNGIRAGRRRLSDDRRRENSVGQFSEFGWSARNDRNWTVMGNLLCLLQNTVNRSFRFHFLEEALVLSAQSAWM